MGWDWIGWAAAAYAIGQVVGLVVRLLPPSATNRFVPLVLLIVNVVTNAGMVLQRFLEGTGLATALAAGQDYQVAGIGEAGAVIKGCIVLGFAGIMGLLQRTVWEKFGKPVMGKPAGD